MTRIRNVRNITKFKRSINAISPVIATLLMIAIAVVASLVVYAWVSGYLGFQTGKAGKAISVTSVGLNNDNTLTVYVQNAGQGTVQIGPVYVDDQQKADFTNDPTKQVAQGDTVPLTIPGSYNKDMIYDIKVTTTDGTSMTSTSKPGSGTSSPPSANAAPVLASIGAKTVNEGALLTFTATATDSDIPAQTLTFSLDAGSPTGAAITSTGVFTWTPSSTQGSTTPYSITVRVTDDGSPALSDSETIAVTVNDVAGNTAPVLTPIGAKTVNELTALTFTATATDSDLPAQTLTFSIQGTNPGATINPTTGAFAWTPTEAQGPGDYPITIRVTDNGSPAMFDEEVVNVHVDEVANPPQTLFSDNFDSYADNTAPSSSKWSTTSNVVAYHSSAGQTSSDEYASLNNNAELRSIGVSCAGYNTITVSYYRQTDNNVHLTVQWRIGTSGGSWTTLETVEPNTSWSQGSYTLGSGANGQTIQIRFTTDDHNRARVDDVLVTGIPN